MAETFKQLAQTLIPAAVAVIYTVPASTQTIVKHIVVSNNTASTVTNIFLYHNGTGDTQILLPGLDLAAGEWAEFDGSITMAAADTLQAKAGTDAVLGITVHGMEITP